MTTTVAFFIGLCLGTFVGIFALALAVAARTADDAHLYMEEDDG